jgi:septum formation protein
MPTGMEPIILASSSPRRRELLENAGIPFEPFAPEIDEAECDGFPPADRVIALAKEKALAAGSSFPSPLRFALAADTMVCLPSADADFGELALGKPLDAEDARRMLRLLSGRTHFVRTGIALLDREKGSVRTSRSDSAIRFAEMSDDEIGFCLDSGEWMGVAGAYRIQGLGAFFIDRIEGSWSGVVGLPMRELYVILLDAGIRLPSPAS